MTVGGLTRHLVGQSELVIRPLTADPAAAVDTPVVGPLDSCAAPPWTGDDPGGAALDEALRVRSNVVVRALSRPQRGPASIAAF